MRALVTGGAGFIGSNLVELLLKEGHEVRVLDNLSSGHIENISSFIESKDIEFVEGDVTDGDTVANATKGIDVIYHMAASAPQKMGMEIRKERYERAIKWLEGVQAGKIIPDLPLAIDENGNPVGVPLVYGSQKKLRHNW